MLAGLDQELESILAPIIRYRAAKSEYSIHKDPEPYREAYERALEMLGIVDPQKPEAARAIEGSATAHAA